MRGQRCISPAHASGHFFFTGLSNNRIQENIIMFSLKNKMSTNVTFPQLMQWPCFLVSGFLNTKYKNLIIFSLKKKNHQSIHVYDIGWIIIRFADVKKNWCTCANFFFIIRRFILIFPLHLLFVSMPASIY